MSKDNSSEVRDLKEYLDSLDRNSDRRVYDATMVSVLMLQRRGKRDDAIEKRFNINLLDEHRRSVTLGNPSGMALTLTWDTVPAIGVFGDNVGRVSITVKNTSIGVDSWECEATDLLRWLAHHWASLVLSEAGANVGAPGNDNQPSGKAKALQGHDFVQAFRRTTIESLSLSRVGSLLQVTQDGNDNFLVSFDEAVDTLTRLGELLALRLTWLSEIGAGPTDVDDLVQVWRRRNAVPIARVVELTSERRADDAVGQWLTRHIAPTASDPNTLINVQSIGDEPRRLLAAARMMGSLNADDTLEILASLDGLHFEPLKPVLDDVSQRALEQYDRYQRDRDPNEKPVRLGHHLAHWLRTDIKLEDEKPGNPELLLQSWGISVNVVSWRARHIDAIACWQSKSQPVIFLNGNGVHSESAGGRRASLAHEICHILVDRNRFFPVVEVLGGALPKQVEQIARGFQAEFLLPRNTARSIVSRSASIHDALRAITDDFEVSQQLAANQILNANCSLTLDERAYLNRLAQR